MTTAENGFKGRELDAILRGLDEDTVPRRYTDLLEYCTKVADELAQRQAFYTLDLADVLWKVQEWKKRLPKVDIFYAVKANTDPVLLRLLGMLGLSFDCASEGEIRAVLKAGAAPRNILLAHTIKTEEELKFARRRGVDLMTFDNEDELHKIRRFHPGARLLIRIRPVSVRCTFDLSDKFGCAGEEEVRLLGVAKELGLAVVGVSFHVGALCPDPTPYETTIRKCRKLFDLAEAMGFRFSILDIGGGFFGQLGTESLFQEVAAAIRDSLDECFPGGGVRVVAEPGNYVAASAARLVCTIIGRRCFHHGVTRHYFLNDGIYGSFFRDIEKYGLRLRPLMSESEVSDRPEHESRLFGQTCCSEDVVRLSVRLPDLRVGDRLLWENMGSYSQGLCSTFCGMPLPIARHVFVRNHRLNEDWKENVEIVNFLVKHAVFIEKGLEERPDTESVSEGPNIS